MGNNFWYQLFNNSTLAAALAVVIGIIIAVYQYKKQKKIDFSESQKQKIINLLILLDEKVEYVNFILERWVNTYRTFIEGSETGEVNKFLEILEKEETPRLSKVVNEDIPLIDKKIGAYLNLYFSGEKLVGIHKDLSEELKKWHDFVVGIPIRKDFDFKKKISEIPELNIAKIKGGIEELIKGIRAV